MDRIRIREISQQDARRSGFAGRAELLAYLQRLSESHLTPESVLFRIRLHYAGDGDRISLALETDLSPEEMAATAERLHRMDANGKAGPWTRQTLSLIERHPRLAASRLAKMAGREKIPFKADVVKLKKLGLTQSFEVGYEISPRGRVYLAWQSGQQEPKGAE